MSYDDTSQPNWSKMVQEIDAVRLKAQSQFGHNFKEFLQALSLNDVPGYSDKNIYLLIKRYRDTQETPSNVSKTDQDKIARLHEQMNRIYQPIYGIKSDKNLIIDKLGDNPLSQTEGDYRYKGDYLIFSVNSVDRIAISLMQVEPNGRTQITNRKATYLGRADWYPSGMLSIRVDEERLSTGQTDRLLVSFSFYVAALEYDEIVSAIGVSIRRTRKLLPKAGIDILCPLNAVMMKQVEEQYPNLLTGGGYDEIAFEKPRKHTEPSTMPSDKYKFWNTLYPSMLDYLISDAYARTGRLEIPSELNPDYRVLLKRIQQLLDDRLTE